jgi:methyl-accepting chemotaxis protein
MKVRISMYASIVAFGLVTALGLLTILGVSTYSANQVRVGGPLYDRIKLGNDLIADILPPPAYVIEAYLEATLLLQEPAKMSAHKERIAQLRKEFNERQVFWSKSELDADTRKALTVNSYAEVQRFWTIIDQSLLPAIAAGNRPAADKAYEQLTAVYSAHRVIIDDIVKKATEANSALEVTAAQQISMFAWLVWGVSGIVVLVIFGGVVAIALRLIRPVVRMTGVVEQIATGELDLVIPGAQRSDEIGDMAKAIAAVSEVAERKAREEAEAKAQQNEMVARQHKDNMIQLAEGFESAVGEIVATVSSASTRLEASASTLTSTAVRSKELTTAVAAASEEASTNVQSVASATEQLSSSVNEISRQVQESARMAGEAVGQARTTNDRVSELSKAAARIGDVVELINSIAGQTNLLALNATIEAARAGDAGRGFAVVASEVKALAEQTAKATGEISQQISGIQGATQESVVAIKEISSTIERLSEISSTIAAAVEEQGAATQEISRNVQQAAQGTQQVSSNIADVQHGATETGSASSQVLSEAQTLSADSNRLKLEVGKFLDSVRAA